jgi:hypothetical protein
MGLTCIWMTCSSCCRFKQHQHIDSKSGYIGQNEVILELKIIKKVGMHISQQL